jgi:transposase-like protein
MPGPKATPVVDRFWARVEKQERETAPGLGPCWLYGGRRYGNKYGQISLGPGLGHVPAHRFSMELHGGPIPRGKFGCHRCDVRNCVNPDHLYAGDHEDNTADIVERKRISHTAGRPLATIPRPGELPRNRALSMETAERMRKEYESGKWTQMQLARRYGVSQGTVSGTIRRIKNMGAVHGGAPRTGHYRVKVTEEAKAQMRALYATGKHTQQALAEKFECDQTYVSLIVRGKK